MKKITTAALIGLILAINTISFAQKFGVRAGLNLSNFYAEDALDSDFGDLDPLAGFHVGGVINFPISGIFSFEPGLMYSTKGFKSSDSDGGLKREVSFNLRYLDMPLLMKASFNMGKTKIFGLCGPYIGLGLTAELKNRLTFEGQSETYTDDIKWEGDSGDDQFKILKRLDHGFIFGAGLDFKSFVFQLNYHLGLANIAIQNDEGAKISNRVFQATIGYNF